MKHSFFFYFSLALAFLFSGCSSLFESISTSSIELSIPSSLALARSGEGSGSTGDDKNYVIELKLSGEYDYFETKEYKVLPEVFTFSVKNVPLGKKVTVEINLLQDGKPCYSGSSELTVQNKNHVTLYLYRVPEVIEESAECVTLSSDLSVCGVKIDIFLSEIKEKGGLDSISDIHINRISSSGTEHELVIEASGDTITTESINVQDVNVIKDENYIYDFTVHGRTSSGETKIVTLSEEITPVTGESELEFIESLVYLEDSRDLITPPSIYNASAGGYSNISWFDGSVLTLGNGIAYSVIFEVLLEQQSTGLCFTLELNAGNGTTSDTGINTNLYVAAYAKGLDLENYKYKFKGVRAGYKYSVGTSCVIKDWSSLIIDNKAAGFPADNIDLSCPEYTELLPFLPVDEYAGGLSIDNISLLYEEDETPYAYFLGYTVSGKPVHYLVYLLPAHVAAECDSEGTISDDSLRYSAFPVRYKEKQYFVTASQIPCYTMPSSPAESGAGGMWAGTDSNSNSFVYRWNSGDTLTYIDDSTDDPVTYTLDSSESDGYIYCFKKSSDADAEPLYLLYINGNLYKAQSL